MRNLSILFAVVGATHVASADPPRSHDVGVIGGAGLNISATGGPQFEVGLHVRDVVAVSGSATMMGEWYHAMLAARWFPIEGTWRPYVLAGVGALNQEALFENFVVLGVGGEHRSSSGHWAMFGELAVDQPTSASRDSMPATVRATPYLGLGVRFYL